MVISFHDMQKEEEPIFTVNYDYYKVKPSVGDYVSIDDKLYKVDVIIIDYIKDTIYASVNKL